MRSLVQLVFFLAWVGWVSGVFAVAGPRPSRNSGSDRAVLGGLAEVDSLLAAGRPDLATVRIRLLIDDFGSDPVNGWQLKERLGVALLRDGQPALALPFLETAIRRNPELWLGHRNLGAALMAMGRQGRAFSEFQQAVELAPDNFKVRLEFGQVLLEFHDYAKAAVHLESARKLCPDCAGIKPALAHLYLVTGKPGQAVTILRSIHADTPSRDSRRSLAQALQAAGQDSLLLELWSKTPLAELGKDEILLLVETEGKMGRFEYSLDFAGLLEGASNAFFERGGTGGELAANAEFWGHICLNLLQSGYLKEGLQAADMAVSLAPDEVVFRNNRVVLLTKLGRHDEAAREWNKVLEMDPSLAKQETP